MRSEEKVLFQIEVWAKENEFVRAVVLTSSRVHPEKNIDFLSDYDIELYVSDLKPFKKNDDWLSVFGDIMVRWPYKPITTDFGDDFITRLILFKDYVRIDFQITDKTKITPNAYEDGYKILIDKDNLVSNLNQPTFKKYVVKKPTKEEYNIIVNNFWWNATYVPKYLKRDELPFAMRMLGQELRDKYLRIIIEWYIGIQNNWSVNTGIAGRHFKKYLDNKIWSEYELTCAGADIDKNWKAFFAAIDLFRKLAKIISSNLGYNYPKEIDQDITEYFQYIYNKQ